MKVPSDRFTSQFIELFPSDEFDQRLKLKLALDDLEKVPDSFCGAAWFYSQDFSYISPQVETIFGHPYQKFFEWGVIYLHSIVPSRHIPEIMAQAERMVAITKQPAFKISDAIIFRITGTAQRPDGNLVTCTQYLAMLDYSPARDSYFFVGCWHNINNRTEKEIATCAARIEALLKRIVSLYFLLYPQRLLAINQPVSAREKEVLAFLSAGLTTKEISKKLDISFHTVESHRKNLIRKFDARNTAELLTKASQKINL